jgi:hypothetical protein
MWRDNDAASTANIRLWKLADAQQLGFCFGLRSVDFRAR